MDARTKNDDSFRLFSKKGAMLEVKSLKEALSRLPAPFSKDEEVFVSWKKTAKVTALDLDWEDGGTAGDDPGIVALTELPHIVRWRTHGGGWRFLYSSRSQAVVARMIATDERFVWAKRPKEIEVKQETRHPLSTNSRGQRAGKIKGSWAATDSPNDARQFVSALVTFAREVIGEPSKIVSEMREPFLTSKVGDRFPHTVCPFSPTRDKKRDPVIRLSNGIYCHVCGKFQPINSAEATPAFKLIRDLVRGRAHWSHAEQILKALFPKASRSETSSLYWVAIRAFSEDDRAIVRQMVSKDLEGLVLTTKGWEFRGSPILKDVTLQSLLASHPAALEPTEKSGWRANPRTVTRMILGAAEFPVIEKVPSTIEFSDIKYADGVVSLPAFKFVTSPKKWDSEKARKSIERKLPGFPYDYAKALIIALREARDAHKMLPIMIVEGASGSGKSLIPVLMAHLFEGRAVLTHISKDKSLSDKLIQILSGQPPAFIVLDEYMGRMTESSLVEFLLIGRQISGRRLYVGEVSETLNTPIVATNTSFDSRFLQSAQVRRRAAIFSVEGALKPWSFPKGIEKWYEGIEKAVSHLLYEAIEDAKRIGFRRFCEQFNESEDVSEGVEDAREFLAAIAAGKFSPSESKKLRADRGWIKIETDSEDIEAHDEASRVWSQWSNGRLIPLMLEEAGFNLGELLQFRGGEDCYLITRRGREKKSGKFATSLHVRLHPRKRGNGRAKAPDQFASSLMEKIPKNISFSAGEARGEQDRENGREYMPDPPSWFDKDEWKKGYERGFFPSDGGSSPSDGSGSDSGSLPSGSGSDSGSLPSGSGSDSGSLPSGSGSDSVSLPSGSGSLPSGSGSDSGSLPSGSGSLPSGSSQPPSGGGVDWATILKAAKSLDLPVVVMDLETRSNENLSKIGSYKYLESSNTKLVLGTAAILETRTVVLFGPHASLSASDAEVIERAGWQIKYSSLADEIPEGATILAHNCEFEREACRKFGLLDPAQFEWADTMLLAAELGHQNRSLDALCNEYGIPAKHGQAEAMVYLKPKGKKAPKLIDEEAAEKITRYCLVDTLITAALASKIDESLERTKEASALLNAEVPDIRVKKIKRLHVEINERGIPVSSGTAEKLLEAGGEALQALSDEVERETGISLASIRKEETAAQIQERLKECGIEAHLTPARGKEKQKTLAEKKKIENRGGYTNLTSSTIEELLSDERVDETTKKILRLRKESTAATSKKLEALKRQTNSDERLRGQFKWFGAHTGRWSGKGVQPQNFSRKVAVHSDLIASMSSQELEKLAKELGVADFFRTATRAAIQPPEPKRLLACDFSQVEARVLAWLADDKEALRGFVDSDPYKEMAAKLFSKPVSDIEKHERQIGKMVILACGYGMGPSTFADRCATAGVDLKAAGISAREAVETFRSVRRATVKFWKRLERGLMEALKSEDIIEIQRPSIYAYKAGDDVVSVVLPNGRQMFYRSLRIEKGELKQSGKRMYGGLLAENIVSAVSRDLLAGTMQEIDALGMSIVAHIHDEFVIELDPSAVEKSQIAEDIEKAIRQTLAGWDCGDSLPIAAEFFTSKTFAKGPLTGGETKVAAY